MIRNAVLLAAMISVSNIVNLCAGTQSILLVLCVFLDNYLNHGFVYLMIIMNRFPPIFAVFLSLLIFIQFTCALENYTAYIEDDLDYRPDDIRLIVGGAGFGTQTSSFGPNLGPKMLTPDNNELLKRFTVNLPGNSQSIGEEHIFAHAFVTHDETSQAVVAFFAKTGYEVEFNPALPSIFSNLPIKFFGEDYLATQSEPGSMVLSHATKNNIITLTDGSGLFNSRNWMVKLVETSGLSKIQLYNDLDQYYKTPITPYISIGESIEVPKNYSGYKFNFQGLSTPEYDQLEFQTKLSFSLNLAQGALTGIANGDFILFASTRSDAFRFGQINASHIFIGVSGSETYSDSSSNPVVGRIYYADLDGNYRSVLAGQVGYLYSQTEGAMLFITNNAQSTSLSLMEKTEESSEVPITKAEGMHINLLYDKNLRQFVNVLGQTVSDKVGYSFGDTDVFGIVSEGFMTHRGSLITSISQQTVSISYPSEVLFAIFNIDLRPLPFPQQVQKNGSFFLRGDVNLNGNVTIADVHILNSSLNGSGPALEYAIFGDVDGNHVVNQTDVEFLLKYVQGKGKHPVGESMGSYGVIMRGDVDWDGILTANNDLNIPTDSSFIANYIFGSGEAPNPLALADANGDGKIMISDSLWISNYLLGISPAPTPLFRGDINNDGIVTNADVTYLTNYIYSSGPAPFFMKTADLNGNGVVDSTDHVYLVNFLNGAGQAPVGQNPQLPKHGCEYDNPACEAGYVCQQGSCNLWGCNYNNPVCPYGSTCTNNVCSTPPTPAPCIGCGGGSSGPYNPPASSSATPSPTPSKKASPTPKFGQPTLPPENYELIDNSEDLVDLRQNGANTADIDEMLREAARLKREGRQSESQIVNLTLTQKIQRMITNLRAAKIDFIWKIVIFLIFLIGSAVVYYYYSLKNKPEDQKILDARKIVDEIKEQKAQEQAISEVMVVQKIDKSGGSYPDSQVDLKEIKPIQIADSNKKKDIS